MAYVGGLRFTIYAVPDLALGIAFLIVELSNLAKNRVSKYLLMSLLTIAILAPNIKHIIGYRVPPVFSHNEVLVLDSIN
jgi:dolichyl-diphosphooligosaccharide--protein glycosyltransferase/undecaprenyl-diphosphooligosaccharide--protein glycosyltransferase